MFPFFKQYSFLNLMTLRHIFHLFLSRLFSLALLSHQCVIDIVVFSHFDMGINLWIILNWYNFGFRDFMPTFKMVLELQYEF